MTSRNRGRSRLALGVLAAALLCSPIAALAQEADDVPPADAPPPPSDPRDFSGVWWAPRPYQRQLRTVDKQLPPFTPKARAEWERNVAAEKAGTPVADAPTQCFPHGTPRLIIAPYPVRFVHSPGKITVLHEVAHNVRTIHLDKAAAPANTPLTFLGYSTARWEGDTLVVTTTHLNDRTRVDEEAITHGTKLKVTERWRKINGGRVIENMITIEDPDHFTAPWTARHTWNWRPDVTMTEYSCEENNRNAPVDGVTVAK